MLDDLNLEKYAKQKLKVPNEEYLDDNKPIPLDTKKAKYVSYFNRIKQQIQLVWIYPIQAAEKKIIGQLTLKFEISRDGNLLNVGLTNSSGFNILDVAAIKAVKVAAPYYPFPITIKKKKLSILATFVYNPNQFKPKDR
jgi:protein TonB